MEWHKRNCRDLLYVCDAKVHLINKLLKNSNQIKITSMVMFALERFVIKIIVTEF